MTEATRRVLDQTRTIRRSLDGLLDTLPDAAWTAIPPGFSNHILWNVGHVVVTAELLTYGLAGLPLTVPADLVAACRKGTSPADWAEAQDVGEARVLLATSLDRIEADVEAGRFEAFREYRTTPGVVLASVDDAVSFNLFHEGLHFGSVLALRKLVA